MASDEREGQLVAEPLAAVVWHPRFLEYKFSEDHPMNPIRLDLTIRLAAELGVLDGIKLLQPQPADDSEIKRVHVPEYVSAVRRAPNTSEPPGYGLGPPDNPVFEQIHEASSLIVGGSILAAESIVNGKVKRAVSIAGGLHHAMAGQASGFCIYNDCAVAISWFLDHGAERIAYVDVDVHHGDGVQAAFYEDPRVLTISLHQHPASLWPHTGFPTEVGAGAAKGTSVNVALPPGTKDSGWLRAFHAIVPPLLAAFRPQVLVSQCGVDTHEEDPLAGLELTVDGHRAIYRVLRELAERFAGGKWLALGGGGYATLRVVPRSWTHLIATMLNRDLDPNAPVPVAWRNHLTRLAPKIVPPTTMTDGCDPNFVPWKGVRNELVDSAIQDTRHAVFSLCGLNPEIIGSEGCLP